eukprot:3114523-Amphidinium_carterae.2
MALTMQHIDDAIWNDIHLSSAHVRIARLSFQVDANVRSSGALKMLASKTQEMARANLVGPRECANIMWASATLQGSLPELQEP